MNCPNCHNVFADSLPYCPYCGYDVSKDSAKKEEPTVPKFKINTKPKNKKETVNPINTDALVFKKETAATVQPSSAISNQPTTPPVPAAEKSETAGTAKPPLTREDINAMQKKALAAEKPEVTEPDEPDEPDALDESENGDEVDKLKKKKRLTFKEKLFGKKNASAPKKSRFKKKSKDEDDEDEENEEIVDGEENEDDEDDKYDVNLDGYYDD